MGDEEKECFVEHYEVLECQGCNNVVFRRRSCPEDFEDDPFYEEDEHYYPPVISRALPRWRRRLPGEIKAVMEEVYKALDAEGCRLAMMGTRAVLDMAILDKFGDLGTFARKLTVMEKKGFLSTVNKEFVVAALEAGHAAAHRGHEPTARQVNQVIDIIEHLLQAIYALGPAAHELRETTPKRKKDEKNSP